MSKHITTIDIDHFTGWDMLLGLSKSNGHIDSDGLKIYFNDIRLTKDLTNISHWLPEGVMMKKVEIYGLYCMCIILLECGIEVTLLPSSKLGLVVKQGHSRQKNKCMCKACY